MTLELEGGARWLCTFKVLFIVTVFIYYTVQTLSYNVVKTLMGVLCGKQ